MNRVRLVCCLLAFLELSTAAPAADKPDLKALLEAPILAPQQTLTETQAFCATRVAPLPEAKSAAEWGPLADTIRQQTLERTVFRGEAAKWRDAKLGVEWLDEIPGGPGYKIKKLRYEALPGLWVPALLYEPEKLSGKVPVFLNVNGHDSKGKTADYKQLRCINQAKRGIIALNPEWFGMGQFSLPGYAHGRLNQIDLCGTSGLAPFYLSLKRGLDVLLSLPNADPARVGVAGLSGGGWQTILISSLDTRVTLSNPVAGYSSFITRGKNFSDLGDSEQSPVDLATTADYSHLTALLAPRPTLLTYNLNDQCCFKADHALPPLLAAGRPFFRLFDKDDNFRYHINAEPGTHNFEKENREALYQMIGRHFFAGDKSFDASEIPSEGEIKTPEQLLIDLPKPNADFHTLALELARSLPRDPALPKSAAAARAWQSERRTKLAEIVKARRYEAQPEPVSEMDHAGMRVTQWKLKLDAAWTVPVVELNRASDPRGTVLLVADAGRAGLAAEAERHLAKDRRVVLIDPFYFGEAKVGQREYLWGLLISTVGERPLGVQAGQIGAVARWLADQRKTGPVTLISQGPRTSLIALVAAALEDKAVGTLELNGSMVSLKEVLAQDKKVEEAPELFCFGLLEAFDLKQIAALIAPRHLEAPDTRDRLPADDRADLEAFFEMLQRNTGK